jgi:hypothetical protein
MSLFSIGAQRSPPSSSISAAFERYAYSGICCPHTFIGTLTQDGNVIQGVWPPGPNQAPHDGHWRRCTAIPVNPDRNADNVNKELQRP